MRRARLASARGDHQGALTAALRARAAASDADPAETAFYAYAAGEFARLAGDAEAARAAFVSALRERPDDPGALIGLARVDAAEGETGAAIVGLRAAAAVAPQPEVLALLGDLLTQEGDLEGAARQFETVRLIARLGDVQGVVYDRALLRFELDHGGDAAAVLAAAQTGLAQRPDAGGHDLVAWALHRLDRDAEALQAIEAARATGADDARLRFHDGAIRIALGDLGTGRALLKEALALGPALDPVERSEAAALLPG